ncbi:endonuclease III [Candidatus Peregrinibacteria bacterium]|nr:endonuclease III [Candidatus Peregrinibacteria bacterium]
MAADVQKIISILSKTYPNAKIELNFRNTYELFVAVVLSAQCTDKLVNKVTPAVFAKLPTVYDMAAVDIGELENMIYSTGFYKNKAKNLKAAAEVLVRDFNGKMPDTMSELLKLPGVARKTANVILNAGFGKNEGVVVDTHVCRLTGKLGLVPQKLSRTKNAVKIEGILMKKLPRNEWGHFSYLLVWHGRRICIARKPKCTICPLNEICPSAEM